MKPGTSNTVVIAGVGVAVIATVIDELTNDTTKRAPAVFVPLGGVLIAVPLLILAEVEPDLAAMLAMLIMLGALTLHHKAITSITSTLNTKSVPNTKPATKTATFQSLPPRVA